jgi:hypothetical protein
MLTDPRAALGEQNTVAMALTGLARFARMVRAFADTDPQPGAPAPADDLVYLLLGVARLGAAVERLAAPAATAGSPAPTDSPRAEQGGWLR